MTRFSTGNLERDRLLFAAVVAYGNDREAIRACLPSDFDAGDDEISAVLADMEPTFEGEPRVREGEAVPFDPVTGRAIAAPHESAATQPPVDTPKAAPRPKSHAEAVAELQAADMELADCRTRVRATTAAVQEAKRLLQLEIEKHIAANPNPWTPEMNSRAYAQASLEARRQHALKYGAKSATLSANRFVQKRMQGYGPKRGGQSHESAARSGYVVPGSPASTTSAAARIQAGQHATRGLTAPGEQRLAPAQKDIRTKPDAGLTPGK